MTPAVCIEYMRELAPPLVWLLGLSRWSIDCKSHGLTNGEGAIIFYDSSRHQATIVCDPADHKTKRDVYLSLAHELAHLVTASLGTAERQLEHIGKRSAKIIGETIEDADENVATTIPLMLERLGVTPAALVRRHAKHKS